MGDSSTGAVWRVPAPHGGRVLNLQTALIKNGLFALQAVASLLGCLVPAFLGVAAGQALFPDDADKSFVVILVGLGLTGVASWFLFGRLLRNPWSSRYVFHKTRAEFLRRPDPVVDPNHPDAILVEVIPRRNWGKFMLESAEDQGFLLVDQQRGQLLLEGDKNRYRIPAPAVVSSAVEVFNDDAVGDECNVPVGMVVLTFRDERLGERAVPLLPRRTVSGDTLGGNYVERARELQRRIQTLSGG